MVDNLKIPITPGLPEVATFLPVVNFVALKYLTKTPGGQSWGTPAWSLKAGVVSRSFAAIKKKKTDTGFPY